MLRTLLSIPLLLTAITTGTQALAHTAWLEPDPARPQHYRLLFGGHAGALENYAPDKLQSVTALDSAGEALPVTRQIEGGAVVLVLDQQTAVLGLYFDNGIWTRDPMGRSVNQPMDSVPGATAATWAVKYHKTVFAWTSLATRPLGQDFEVTPLQPSQPRAGEPMQVRVTLHGEPLAGVQLGHGEIGDMGPTDENGIAEFMPRPGFNRLWAGKRLPVEETGYSELSYEYLLGFTAAAP